MVILIGVAIVAFMPNTQQIMRRFAPAFNAKEWVDVAPAMLSWTWTPNLDRTSLCRCNAVPGRDVHSARPSGFPLFQFLKGRPCFSCMRAAKRSASSRSRSSTAVVAALLPDDPYQRWQLLDGTIQKNVRWIYERTNFDPTPIDVVILGPSRSAADMDSLELEADLARMGIPAHVVNFSLPEAGRDVNYAIARELFKTKNPKVLVLGVIEKPSRFGHPAFKYIAPSWLVADPGYFINLNYLSNLIYLPYRQMELFLADLWPSLMGLTKTFNPETYRGSNIDTTGAQFFPDRYRVGSCAAR